MTNPAANPYAQSSVQTASPARLVTMLYDRLLVSLHRSRDAEARGTPDAIGLINAELQRAQDILDQLRFGLDHEAGGEVAANLDALYGWCCERVVAANLSKDLADVAVVERVVTDLRDAWVQACELAAVPA